MPTPQQHALARRAAARRRRLEVHVAHTFADAEDWDLRFWQRQGPAGRLAALAAIHRDLAQVRAGKRRDRHGHRR